MWEWRRADAGTVLQLCELLNEEEDKADGAGRVLRRGRTRRMRKEGLTAGGKGWLEVKADIEDMPVYAQVRGGHARDLIGGTSGEARGPHKPVYAQVTASRPTAVRAARARPARPTSARCRPATPSP